MNICDSPSRSRYNGGCRCTACTLAAREYNRSAIERRKSSDFAHGTRAGYCGCGCRCAQCRAAWAEYIRKLRAERAVRLAENQNIAQHGTPATYGNYGCRCRECTRAACLRSWERKQVRRQERSLSKERV